MLSAKAESELSKVAVVVLNWNRAKATINCLESLLPMVEDGLGMVICCDNASNDDSVTSLESWAHQYFLENTANIKEKQLEKEKKGTKFVLIQTPKNGGYAAGNNAALRFILAQDYYEFVWILNNDTVVDSEALYHLLKYSLSHPEMPVIGSTLVDYHDRELVQCAGGCRYLPALTIMWNVFGGKSLSKVLEYPKLPQLDYIHGAAVFLSTRIISEIGFLNENFFLYYEELDYALRLKAKGYKLGWCPRSVVYHIGAVTTGGRATSLNQKSQAKQESFLANYHENLSTLIFTQRHYPYYLPLVSIFRLSMKIMIFSIFRRWHLFKPLFMAYRDFIKFRHQEVPSLATYILFYGIYS